MKEPRAAHHPVSQANTAPSGWATGRERSHLWLMRVMRGIALAAGRRLTRVLLHPITLYFMLTAGPARRHSRQYLNRALGRPAGWPEVYRHLYSFAATVLDRVYFLSQRFDRFEIGYSGVSPVLERLARGEGAFMVGAHVGSFEVLRAIGQDHGRRVAMVMYEDNARLINATLAAIAPPTQAKTPALHASRMHTIGLGRLGAMLEMRQWLDDGGIAGLLGDRTLGRPASRARSLRLPFLGAPAAFSDGPFRLAAMLRRPVVFMVGLYHGGARYELRFVPLADFSAAAMPAGADLELRIREAVERYVALLEALCREAPYNWFNFFDFWADDATLPDVPTAESSPAAGRGGAR